MGLIGWNPEALRRARRRYEIEHGDITQAEIGRRVAAELGRPDKPISDAVVSLWFNGRDPRYSEGLALARVLGADPWELGIVEEGETKTPPQSGAAEDTGQIKTPIKRVTVQGQRVDMGRGGRGKRTG